MPPESLHDAFLAHEGIALFEFRGSGLFEPLAALPEWCDSLWQAKGRRPILLAERSPFLENFLEEAREFWNSQAAGAANSGNWMEQDSSGRQVPLEASAFWLAGKRVLLIRSLSRTFQQQQHLFQTARDSLLMHERLMGEIQKKEILLYCIIHDLSQPLTSMRGCFDLLLGKKLTPDISKFVHTGQRESERQERMIRGILDAFSGDLTSATASERDARSADLVSCARRALEQFTPAFTQRGIQLRLAPYLDSQHGWRVRGEASRIDRIFGNLIENALRYSPKGSTVTIGLEESGSSLAAFVDDEGPGLPGDASPESLFALFHKGKERPGKAGLGLYFCKMTVERFGGTIGAANRPEGGSRFWFRLPRAESKDSVAGSPNPTAPGSLVAPDSSSVLKVAQKALHIVVAEDDEAVRDLAVEMLRSRGHSVTGARDGRAALALVERLKPDVLLLDQQMPKMDGLQLARAIRQREKNTGRRAILIGLSGRVSPEDERRALDAGMDALLSKPFERASLFQLIERPAVPRRPLHMPNSVVTEPQPTDLRAHLAQITAGNEKLARRLVAGFLRDLPPKLAAIERAVTRKDAGELAASAHALRGAFAIFNAQRSLAAARKLEALARDHQLEEAPEEFRALADDLSRLERELRALYPQLSSRPKSPPHSSPAAGSRGTR